MILRVVAAEIHGPDRLVLSFNDGVHAEVDVRPLLDDGPVFGPLHDPEYFGRGTLDLVCGTIVWPNGADFAPEALRALVRPSTIAEPRTDSMSRKGSGASGRALSGDVAT